jgi:8-oxo-dGTP pyrophosphatase MutT (NUDIX family)
MDAAPPAPAIPAATVVVVRDQPDGLEVLMLRRNSKLAFGGMWVFPGGRVDPGDLESGEREDELAAARRAAVREALEEAGLNLDPDAMVPLAHWTPPPQAPRRFITWFFLAPAPAGGRVLIDGGEIHDHGWLRPADALAQRDAREIELAPPTWVTLWRLAASATVDDAMVEARNHTPERFATHMALVDGAPIALFHGDAGYDDADASRPGGRHRLSMLGDGWRYERSR